MAKITKITLGGTEYDVGTDTTYSAGSGITMNGTQISVNGAPRVWSRGNVTAETGASLPAVTGMSMAQVYNNGYPIPYGNIITLYGSGCGQILVGWSGTNGGRASVYVRSKRDVQSAEWSPWYELKDSGNLTVVSKTAAGLCPALPNEDTTTKYLRQDGTWVVPPNTTYSAATQSAAGLMSADDKKKLDGIASGAQVNSVTGVKGNGESTYRTGNVNITKANVELGNVANALQVYDKANVSGNMNQAAGFRNAIGMISLSGTDAKINPNGQTSWHHFINMSYQEQSGSNMWQTQIAVKAGTTDPWIRSRAGGAIVDGTAWMADWVRILTGSNWSNVITKTALGIGNVENLAQGKAIKSITRSGTTFTYTCLDGTTGTFTQQDNNTTYSAGAGLALNGTTFKLRSCYAKDNTTDAASKPWHKFASVTINSGAGDKFISFIVYESITGANRGILQFRCRVNSSVSDNESATLAWLVKWGLDSSKFVWRYVKNSGSITYELWCSITQWHTTTFVVQDEGSGAGEDVGTIFTLHNTTAGEASYTAGAGGGTSALSGEVLKVNGHTVESNVPANAVFTDTKYNFSGTTFVSGYKDSGEHNANNAIQNGVYYYTSNGPATTLGASTNDGALFVQRHSDNWVVQIAQDYRNGRLFVRGKNNGTWQDWKRIANYDEIIGDTKNTAGSTDTSSKIFLIGATSQAANPQTYSHDTAYVGTDGCLYSGGAKVLTAHQDISGKVSKSGDTMSGVLKNSYNASTWVNGLTNAALTLTGTAYNSCICSPTKDGNISISTWPGGDNDLCIGYGEKGRTTNSFVKSLKWTGTNGNLQVDMINGVTVGSSPKFTDTNTWRGIQDNLTSDSTTDSLSAAQGKALANGSARDNTKLPLSGGTLTGALTLAGMDLRLGTNGSSSNDSGDISWHYGNGNEKCRIWTDNNPTIAVGPNYRIYKSDGTELYNGRLATIGDLPSLGANTFKVTRALSVSTTTNGYWAAMCNSTQTGTPTLPTAGQWWHVISMDWSGNDANNWISQLAVATQQNNGVWWRRNTSSGTSINSSTWNRLAEGDASGNAKNALTVNGLTVQTAVPANAKFTDTLYNFAGATFNSGDKDTAGHDCDTCIQNGVYYYTSHGPAQSLGATTDDGALFVQRHSDNWVVQIASDYRNGSLFVRSKNNGTWMAWRKADTTDLGSMTGTLPVSKGGTGATTRLGALQNLTSEEVGTSSQYFLTITTNWTKGGYCSVNDAKTVLGLGNKADLASPTFTGTPKAPTAASGTNSTQIATTEFVNNATSEFFAKSLGRAVLLSGGVLTQASGQQIWQRSQAVVMLTDGTKITVIPQNCNSQDIDIYKKSDGTQYIWYNGSLSGYSKFLDYDALIKTDGSSQSVITVDTALSSTSTNPVQNKVVNTALEGKQAALSVVTWSASGYNITAAKYGRIAMIGADTDAVTVSSILPSEYRPLFNVYLDTNNCVKTDGTVKAGGLKTFTYITAS